MKKWICVVLMGLTMGSFGDAGNVHDIIMAGEKLSPGTAEQVEKQLVEQPRDVVSRKKMLGYYWLRQHQDSEAKSARQQHVLWMIENALMPLG